MIRVRPDAAIWRQTAFRRHRSLCFRAVGLSLLTTTALVLLATPARSQTVWTGALNDQWTSNGNWSTNAVPNAANGVEIGGATPHTPTIDGIAAASSSLVVGHAAGDGRLDISSGGTLTTGDVLLGVTAGNNGFLSLTGSTSRLTANWLQVGLDGAGTLEVLNGADVITNTGVVVGAYIGSSGRIHLSGTGTTMTSALQELALGTWGHGVLEIANGATLLNSSTWLATEADGTALASVDNATLASGGSLRIGYRGEASMSVVNGGLVQSFSGIVGDNAGADGTMLIDGAASRWEMTGALSIGSSGAGLLDIRNGGTVIADNGITIGTTGSGQGSVIASGPGSTLRTVNSVTIGFDGEGSMTLADGADLWVGTALRLGQTIDGGGVLNIGGAANQAAAAPGTISNVGTVQFGAGAGTVNFNHTGAGYAFDLAFDGNGTIDHAAGTTTFGGNSQSFTGITNVTGGTLRVNNRFGGDVYVSAGGVFGGDAELIGALLDIRSAGVLSPGNSIGTVHAIDVAFDAGSFYDVEVNAAGQSDRLDVQNLATLNGGTVRVSAAPDHVLDQPYAILYARSGVVGTFNQATTALAFVTPVLSYDANNVYLTLLQSLDMEAIAETPNQEAVAEALDVLGPNDPVVLAFPNLTVDEALAGFDALSGEGHASAQSVLLDGSKVPRDAVLDRSWADDQQLWGIVQASHLAVSGDGNAAGLASSRLDLVGGIDDFLGDWRVGFLLHGGIQGLSIPERSTTANIGNPGLGAYARGRWDGTGIDLGGAVTAHDIRTVRNVSVGNLDEQLTAHYLGVTGQVFGRLFHEFAFPDFALVPYGEAAYVVTAVNGFTETGGQAALSVDKALSRALVTTLGLDVARELALEDGSVLSLRAGLGWRHVAADIPTGANQFQGQGFTVSGVGLPADALVIDAGLEWARTDTTRFGLAYDGMLGAGAQSHAIKASFATEF